MRLSRIFILFVFVDAVRCQCDGNHVNLQAEGRFRILYSPNYRDEHGKKTNCTWIINLPLRKQYVMLYVADLRLHYLDYQNNTHCMPSYDFRINGEKFGCEPGHFVSTERNEFCIQFRAPTCARLEECSDRQTLDKVQITFNSDGARVKTGQTSIMTGFRLRYGIFDCPEFGTSRPSTNARTKVTRTNLAASTHRPLNTLPGNRNSVGRPQVTESTPRRTTALSAVISTVRTTTTKGETNKAIPTSSKSIRISSAKTDLSNEIPIWVSDASNATRGAQLASTASPTANKSRGEDDFDTKLSYTIDLHWIILASALGGGLLLILVVAICCKIQRKKKSKLESEETDTGDSSSNHDKTEIPAYLTVEDVSSNQESSQQEATNQNATQTDSKLDEKLVVENVAYESPTTSISQPDSTLAESIQNDEDKPAIIDEPGDEFYSVVRLKSNNEKTTVRYLKENILYSEAP